MRDDVETWQLEDGSVVVICGVCGLVGDEAPPTVADGIAREVEHFNEHVAAIRVAVN